MNKLKFNLPCVLRLLPGWNNDNPIIVLFDDPEDALTYWHENMYDDDMDGTEEGYNHLHIDDEVEVGHFNHVDIKHVSHDDLLKFIKRGEEHWMRKICEKYPTEEEEYNRWYSMMERTGNISAYEANLDYYDPLEDDPDLKYADWCLKNNLAKNDCEAKRYVYITDHGFYPWDVFDCEDDDYRIYVMSELGLELEITDYCKYCVDCTCRYCDVNKKENKNG